MLTDRERLMRQKAQPVLVSLHRALSRLTSTLTVMNTGAHPDDEQNGMLAVMRFAYGMRVVVACSTRGEGGQNGIGPERTAALGVVRTREMEEAARVLDADVAWLGHGPDDPVHDFGFSKNGKDTLARWGKERLLERLVRAYRRERPDIVIPTFLDVPGQHGHHRAMTEAAETAIALAADPDVFPEHAKAGLTPWRVAKYYLPAWSGGGGTYDDEVPPPNTTVTVMAPGRDAATGAAFDQIGEWSRAYHATQGMGQWQAEPQQSWALHLKLGDVGAETDIRDGLPGTLGALGAGLSGTARAALERAEAAIGRALGAFPHAEPILAALSEAAGAIEAAQAALGANETERLGHRLARKLVEIDAALMLAAGVSATAWANPARVVPGGKTSLFVHVEGGAAVTSVTAMPILAPELTGEMGGIAGGVLRYEIAAAPDAAPTSPYPPQFSSLGGNGLARVRLQAVIAGRSAGVMVDLDEPLVIAPAHGVRLDPPVLLKSRNGLARTAKVSLELEGPPARAEIAGQDGIAVHPEGAGFAVTLAPELAAGRHRLPVTINGAQAYGMTPIAYPHIGQTGLVAPAMLDILALDLVLPATTRIGYVGSGNDSVGTWLMRMGLDVTVLGAKELAQPLDGFDTIVVGIFAYGQRPDLVAANGRLKAWVEAGGNLVTLYHRPTDGWNPDATPPRRLAIGSPSLRWRVTDPKAEVSVLEPDHALLAGPNTIGPEDWAGWDKERGLYFASAWDDAYRPLLSMHDKDEAPLLGALVSARIGAGRHTHTSLVLHHQLDKLVPGAFRLLANLVAPA